MLLLRLNLYKSFFKSLDLKLELLNAGAEEEGEEEVGEGEEEGETDVDDSLDAGLTAPEGYIDSKEDHHDIDEQEGQGKHIQKEESTVRKTVGGSKNSGGLAVFESLMGGVFALVYALAKVIYSTEAYKNHLLD